MVQGRQRKMMSTKTEDGTETSERNGRRMVEMDEIRRSESTEGLQQVDEW